MLEISCVINVDTRTERENNEQMFKGVVSRDFIIDGLINKRNLLKGFDFELICFLDLHEEVDERTIAHMRGLCDTLIIRKHDKRFEDNDNYSGFNDLNYISALIQARGKYVWHMDGDVAAFTISPGPIREYLNLLEQYDYISYPSLFSPAPDHNDNYNYWWVSTRSFICKRSTLDFGEIIKCQLDYDYMFNKYPASVRNHWLEHVFGVTAKFNGKGVFYPPVQFDRFILYTWNNYHKYTLQRLNNQTFEEVNNWVCSKPFFYPNNLEI